MSTEERLRAAAAGDVPAGAVRLLDSAVAPGGGLAAALLVYNTDAAPYEAVAFLLHEDGEWGLAGEAYGLGPGHYFVGETGYPFLAARVDDGRAEVDVKLGAARIRRPVRAGHVLAVFWDAPVDDDALDAAPVPKLVRPHRRAKRGA